MHDYLATSLQHMGEWQEGDHDVMLGGPVLAELHDHAAHRRHHILVRQHHAFRHSCRSRCITDRAQTFWFRWLQVKLVL